MQDDRIFNMQKLDLRLEGKKPGMMNDIAVYRAQVPGGWLVAFWTSGMGVTFYPDPEHAWDGGTLDTGSPSLPIPAGGQE